MERHNVHDSRFTYVANISLLFAEVPYAERPKAAKAAGFDQVETWWPFSGPTPEPGEIDTFVDSLTQADVELIGLNFFAGDMPGGERGIASRPDRLAELEANVLAVVEIAERTGCRKFNLLYGQLDDRFTPEEQTAAAVKSYVMAADAVAQIGGTILVEPLAEGLNGAYPLRTPEDAFAVIAEANQSAGRTLNIGLLFDTFHLGSNGVDLIEAAGKYAAQSAHVQLADAPGRGEPGSGDLDIDGTLTALHEGGYRGLVAAEYKPTVRTEDSLGWIVPWANDSPSASSSKSLADGSSYNVKFGHDRNDPDRLERFRDLGLGLFIHWSVDTQLGVDISHSLVGADEHYVDDYFERLPRSFTAKRFAPDEWAALAKLAGVKYMMFTTKHHNGFCMFHTETTQWQVANTPFERDVTAEIVEAFRAGGIAPGFYFSPDDFSWLRENGIPIQRHTPEVLPVNNPGLMELDKAQITELLSNYGDIEFIFFDGPVVGLREHAWDVKPEILVTRGAIPTPEQHIPGLPSEGAWESNMTMGTQWTYKPTNEHYKSGGELIGKLIEIRAKGGNFLLNVGPKPDGTLPIEQEQLLQELALWMFVNGEAIHGTRPWIITNERDLWFTTKDDAHTLYVHVNIDDPWKWGERKEFVLASVLATEATEVSILGQSGKLLEYRPDVDTTARFEQKDDGLHVSALNTQRLYNDRKWPNPVVLKITHVEHAFLPPRVTTASATWNEADGSIDILISLDELGDSATIVVSGEYQDITGLDVTERPDGWETLPSIELSSPGTQTVRILHAEPEHRYAVRARASLPLFSVNGAELTLVVPNPHSTTAS